MAGHLQADITVHDLWIARQECDCQPFDWVNELYEQRRRNGSNTRGYPLKLGINSLYGKTSFRPKYQLAALDAATSPRNFLTRSRASRFYTLGAAAPRARPTEPPREGRADCGADRSAGAG
jgi:hypothetical protein